MSKRELSQEEKDALFQEWFEQGKTIKRQRQKEAIADPLLDAAGAVARWVRNTK